MSETASLLLSEKQGTVLLLTLNRPERLNAWTPELSHAYFSALRNADADPSIRAIVITGAGRGFCAGEDLGLLEDAAKSGEQDAGYSQEPHDVATVPLAMRKPLICAVNGSCAGIGLVLALMCDVIFAAEGAKMTFAFSRRGLVAEWGAAWLLVRSVGRSRALDLLLSSRVFTSDEAFELGIVNKLFHPSRLLPEAIGYATDIANNCSPWAMATIKRQVGQSLGAGFMEAFEESERLMPLSIQMPDFHEGVASFVERREPRFTPLGEID